ncbi:monocarboxylate transporter 13-like [Lytechinus variegatus]|uniref:monocarboxylate transporter 13-like n=1 Tax=Lytechinus variegatus TaxID=7654 RepID=UPI001BB2C029|nr:monocarboxylate transporter 13-like [Lytechinus variegatus]
MASLNIEDEKLDHDLKEDDPAGTDEKRLKEETILTDKEIREGGWGWVIVFWAFFTKLLFSGTVKAFGVLMPNLVSHFGGTSISELGLILALFGTFSDFTGFTSAPLCKVFGARSVAVVGGILCSSGIILASFVTSSSQLAVCLAVAGFGFGFPLVPSLELIRLSFTKRFAIANGLIYSGTGIGVVVFAPLGQVLLDTYGWRGTFMVLGALCLHVVVHGTVLRPIPNSHSRATHGLIIDFGILTSEKLYLMATWALALSLMLCPILDLHAQNMAAAALFGVGNGIVLPLGTVLLKQSTDRDVFRSSS